MTIPFQIHVMEDGPDWLILRCIIPEESPEVTMRWFVEASRLNQWWGEEALIEPRPGGRYEVRWPEMEWTMRGVVAHCDRSCLIYSWTWDHDPDQPARSVIVRVDPDPAGTALTLTHGPYRPTSPHLATEDDDRVSHRDGWLFFLAKLHETIAKTAAHA